MAAVSLLAATFAQVESRTLPPLTSNVFGVVEQPNRSVTPASRTTEKASYLTAEPLDVVERPGDMGTFAGLAENSSLSPLGRGRAAEKMTENGTGNSTMQSAQRLLWATSGTGSLLASAMAGGPAVALVAGCGLIGCACMAFFHDFSRGDDRAHREGHMRRGSARRKSTDSRTPNGGNSPKGSWSPASGRSSQSSIALPPAPSSTSTVHQLGALPLLCPELVLPNMDANFNISMHKLEEAAGSFDLYGVQGKALLRANVEQDPLTGVSRASITMKPASSPVLASITSPDREGEVAQMEVFDANELSYGHLRNEGNLTFVLLINDQAKARMAFSVETGELFIRSVDGMTLAVASRTVDHVTFHNEECLQVRVMQGVDAVLMLLCVIGVVIFGAPAAS